MPTTSARLLALLGLLQSRADWTGPELAERLAVTDRTVRADVARLRELGYPVDAVRGPGGRYRLGSGTKLPPLLLDDAEAVAIAVALRLAGSSAGLTDASAGALVKLDHVLPDRLRRRVAAVRSTLEAGPASTGTDAPDPVVDPDALAEVSHAIRDHTELRVEQTGHEHVRRLEPHRLVAWQQRWYIVARDPTTDAWEPVRLDLVRLRHPGGRRFTPRDVPGGDATAFVLREVAAAGWTVHARIQVDAPAQAVLARINSTVGVVERVDDEHSVLVTGADSVATIAAYIGMLGYDFHVDGPPELVAAVATLGRRYLRATGTDAP
ncbi:WYL domain-containing protein [Cellulomonas sp. DKR-3]|uniref:WYL domain-containing protein n=1 Tax=Cellulomonas fulva TaxID=2835530 RepID=A0ABS5TYC1_9CELL|nr:WYL domain-containing protein [Cellulomonas fulva]MBT0994144.1 WYL domain-containing protein [Cellulomonas fulva]